MKNGVLAAATILIANAASAWCQEIESLPPSLSVTSSELPAGVTEAPPAPFSNNWTGPPLATNSTYFGNPAYASNGGRFWGSAELLLWAIKPGNTPPLVTNGTVDSGGAIGPGTNVLYGGKQDSDPQLGGRFTAGFWLDQGRTRGVEASYFFLNGPSDNFGTSSSGDDSSMILARPFVNAITGMQDSQLISVPGITSGSTQVSSGSQFQGAQLNGLFNLLSSPANCCQTDCCSRTGYRLDLIGGFQYLQLNENLVIDEKLTVLPTAPDPFIPGSMILATDRFETRNNFYGGQVGLRGEWSRGAWFTNVTGQVALGDTHQTVRINGSSSFTTPGSAPIQQQGGLLALPTNIGSYSRDQFSVVPQIGFNVGRQVTNNVRVFAGYTFIYWSNVVRPGDQIDTVVNPTQLPTPTGPGTLVGPARPAFNFHESDLWLQGINLGVDVRI